MGNENACGVLGGAETSGISDLDAEIRFSILST
jgi:hypothetical protein